jgi:acetyl esterase/lipase
VVVSTSYRYAPRYTFPIAHEDVQDVADWLIQNAEKLLGADPTLMSVSGFSVGGNLVLGIAQRLSRSEFRIKAAVLFYTPVGDP